MWQPVLPVQRVRAHINKNWLQSLLPSKLVLDIVLVMELPPGGHPVIIMPIYGFSKKIPFLQLTKLPTEKVKRSILFVQLLE